MSEPKKMPLWRRLINKLNRNKVALAIVVVSVIAGTFGFLAYQGTFNSREAQAALNCPAGYTLSGTSCVRTVTTATVCPSGYSKVSETVCRQVAANKSCPAGWTNLGNGYCQYVAANKSCPAGWTLNNGTCQLFKYYKSTFDYAFCDERAAYGSDSYVTDMRGIEGTPGTLACTFGGGANQWVTRPNTGTVSLDGNGNLCVSPGVNGGFAAQCLGGWPTHFTMSRCSVNTNGNWNNAFAIGTINTRPTCPSGTTRYANDANPVDENNAQLVSDSNFAGGTPVLYSQTAASCPAGWGDAGGNNCFANSASTCPAGWADAGGNNCYTDTSATCPSGYTLSGSTCAQTQTASPTSFTIDNVNQIGNCTPNPATVYIGTPVSCTFALSGAPAGIPYNLPAGTTASISTATGSSACSVSGSNMICSSIPTTGGTAGLRNILVSLGNSAGVDKGDITLQNAPTVITATNIGNSNDCTSAKTVTVPATYVCNFPLTGNPNNSYRLPTNGIKAGTSTGGNTTLLANSLGAACTIVGDGTAQASLNCTQIGTANGTEGLKNVLLSIDGSTTYDDKGDVTLNIAPIVITTNNIGNSSDCTSTKTVQIPNTYTCNFPLTGSTNNSYSLPTNGIRAGTSTGANITLLANSYGNLCTILNNNSTATTATLSCTGIKTQGGTAGARNVLLSVNGATPVDKGDVTLQDPPIQPTVVTITNIGNSDNCTNTKEVLIPGTYDCTFPLSGDANNFYSIPANGIKAFTATDSTGTTPLANSGSTACTIIGNQTAQAKLSCTTIKTAGSTQGLRNVLVQVNNTGAYTDKGDVLLLEQSQPTVIGPTNVGNSTNCTSSLSVTIPETYDCSFPLSGNPYNAYEYPTGGIIGWTGNSNTGTGVLANSLSNACSIAENGTTTAHLLCTDFKTTGGTNGVKNVILEIGTGNMNDRGDVNLVVPKLPTTIDLTNIGTSTDCNSGLKVQIGDTYTCHFPLTGDSLNDYTLPTDPIKASTQSAIGTSSNCTIINNQTPQASLECTGIPTTSATTGLKNVNVQIGTATPTDKGDVSLFKKLTNDDIPTGIETFSCTPNSVLINSATNCTGTLADGYVKPSYSSPTGPVSEEELYAIIDNTGATSVACSFTTDTNFTCNNLPAGSGTGEKPVKLGVFNALLNSDKNNPADYKNSGETITVNRDGRAVTPADILNGTCTPASVVVGTPTNCTFPLKDNGVTYLDPTTGPVTAKVNTATNPTSQNGICQVNGMNLVCELIPTTGAQTGPQNVYLQFPNDTNTANTPDNTKVTILSAFDPNGDDDNDGIPNGTECNQTGLNCPDTDTDGTPDYKDTDTDGDGIPDSIEKGSTCASLTNCTPVDTDGDGKADYRDTDSDGDGIPDTVERGSTCANLTACTPVDTDGDGKSDYIDLDSDGDTIADEIEKGSNGSNPVDTDKDGKADYVDLDSDGDGITDKIERSCSIKMSFFSIQALAAEVDIKATPCDTDTDGTPDYRDLDSDGDNLTDSNEKGSTCSALETCVPKDSNNNGLPDFREKNVIAGELPRTGGFAIAGLIAALSALVGTAFYIVQRQKNNLSKKLDLN